MRRRLLCLLALCGLLSGCGGLQSQEPSQAGGADEAGTAPEEEVTVSESAPLETASYLPESLIQELRDRMQNGTDSYEELVPLQAGRELSAEEAAALAPESLDCESAASAVYSSYCAVDFDNDGVEDLFVNRRMGSGTMGMFSEEFWHGLPDGSYAQTDSTETYMCDTLFIAWEGKTYLLTVQHDLLSKSDVSQFTFTGLGVSLFENGQRLEEAWLAFDPTALWTEGVYDDAGTQTGWVEGAPENRDISLSVYTRGINTDFSPPVH